MPTWLKWAFWVSPLSYGEMGLSLNEFLAPRWQKVCAWFFFNDTFNIIDNVLLNSKHLAFQTMWTSRVRLWVMTDHFSFTMSVKQQLSGNSTIGHKTLENRGLNFDGHLFWVSVGALLGFVVLFNTGFTFALSFLKRKIIYKLHGSPTWFLIWLYTTENAPASGSRAIVSTEKLYEQCGEELESKSHLQIQYRISPHSTSAESHKGYKVSFHFFIVYLWLIKKCCFVIFSFYCR